MPELPSDQEIAKALEELPPVTSILRRLRAVIDDPNSDVDDVSSLIRVDTALTAEVLRLANSAAYGMPGRVTTIEAAIQQTGLNEVARIVTAISAKQLTSRPLTRYRLTPTLLWQHTLAVAVAAELIAERFLLDGATAYMSGMLHPIGIILLDGIAEARGVPAIAVGNPIKEWEEGVFSSDNATLAATVLKGWGMPESLVNAVGTRYTPPKPSSIGEMRGILYLASAIAERVPAGLPPETGLFQVNDAVLGPLRLSKEDYSDLQLEAGQKLSRLRASY